MKMTKKRQRLDWILVLAVIAIGFGGSPNAWAGAAFDADLETALTVKPDSGLPVSVLDTLFNVFKTSIGDATSSATGSANPAVDGIGAGDPPVDLAIGDMLSLSASLGGSSSSTPSIPSSSANASVLGSAFLRIENAGGSEGLFSLDLDWNWRSTLSIDHSSESAGIDLQLVVTTFDELSSAVLDEVVVYSVSRDTTLGAVGALSDAGSRAISGVVDAGGVQLLIIDLFAIDGFAQSELPLASVPATATIFLLFAGLLGLYRHCR